LAGILKVSTRTIRRDIEKLKNMNKLKRIGSEKSGYWKITGSKSTGRNRL
jgi:predicted HTH transcriptional regulator